MRAIYESNVRGAQGGRSCAKARRAFAEKFRLTQFLEIFGSKTVFLGQEVHYYMVYIAYFTELMLQISDYAQKRRSCRKNSNSNSMTNMFKAIFALAETLPSSATLM